MSALNLKSVTTIAAACALSLVSAATFAAGRMGTPAPASTQRMSAPAKPTTTAVKPTTTTKAATTTRTTGQPNASCETTPNQPGNSISAPGSAFNPDGVAGTKYAGTQPQNSKNPNSVSQYDVACARSH